MQERLEFISELLEGECTMTELCAVRGVSRKTGYKWWQRYLEHGLEGLQETIRSRVRRGGPAVRPKSAGPMRGITLIADLQTIRRILEDIRLWAPEQVGRGPSPMRGLPKRARRSPATPHLNLPES